MLYCIVYDKRAVTAVHDARRGNSLPLAAILCTGVYKQPCQRVRASGSAHCLCAPTCAKDRSREERRPGTVLLYLLRVGTASNTARPSSGRSGRLPIAMCMMTRMVSTSDRLYALFDPRSQATILTLRKGAIAPSTEWLFLNYISYFIFVSFRDPRKGDGLS